MDKYREEIKTSLLTLPSKWRVLFAALICERLYPNYIGFQNSFN